MDTRALADQSTTRQYYPQNTKFPSHMFQKSIYTVFCFIGLCYIAVPVYSEPLFDNNGLTTRDKLKTVGVRYGENTQSFRRVDASGSAVEFTASCWEIGLNYGTKEDQSSYISVGRCPDVETDFGSSDGAGNMFSLGYISAFPQSRAETYLDATYLSYPATTHSFGFNQGTVEFSGFAWTWGLGLDIYDGQQFSTYLGFEIDLYTRFGNDVEKKDNYGGYLKFSYLFASDWAIALRAGGTSKEGAAFTLMRSF